MTGMPRRLPPLGERCGVVARASAEKVTIVAAAAEVTPGDLFLVPVVAAADDLAVHLLRAVECRRRPWRVDDPVEIAKARIEMPDAWSAEGEPRGPLLDVDCEIALQAEMRDGSLRVGRVTRVPALFADAYLVAPGGAAESCLREMLEADLAGELVLGSLRAGCARLPSIPVRLRISDFASHVAVLGKTGAGKSHAIGVLVEEARAHATAGAPQRLGLLVLDPHDEHGPDRELRRERPRAPFRYSRADVVPADLAPLVEFEPLSLAFAEEAAREHEERWIDELRLSTPASAQAAARELGLFGPPRARRGRERPVSFHEETIAAVLRRLAFLGDERCEAFWPSVAPDGAAAYRSELPGVLSKLERGDVVAIDTSGWGELEQALVASVTARALFSCRRAVRAATDPDDLRRRLGSSFRRQPTLLARIEEAIATGALPYLREGRCAAIDELAVIALVVEEAPMLLARDRLRPGTLFREIVRQGRKFGIGLVVVSQQVRGLDPAVLAQTGTELLLALGSEDERRAAAEIASAELPGGAAALRGLATGEAILCSTGRRLAMPVSIRRRAESRP
ncbi:MAG TPA: DUF87 domain-containing protein [Planctomycetota bacterium]|nr:DUF87 domain-containing protein [Planctomycetota bacterium]